MNPDYVTIAFSMVDEHLSLVCLICGFLQKSGVTLSFSECNFFSEEIAFLGPAIGPDKPELGVSFINKTLDLELLYSIALLS